MELSDFALQLGDTVTDHFACGTEFLGRRFLAYVFYPTAGRKQLTRLLEALYRFCKI